MDKAIETLEQTLKKAKEIGFFEKISQIPDFLFRPRKFWDEYETMTVTDKWQQFVCYALLFSITIWWASSDIATLSDIGKSIIGELVTVIVYIIIVYLGNVLVNHIISSRVTSIIAFCCYVKLIVLIPQIIFLKLFFLTESYLYFSFAVIFSIIAETYLLIVSCYAFQKSAKRFILACLLTILLINIYDSVCLITGLSAPHNPNFEDILSKERLDLSKSLKGGYDVPTYAVTQESNNKTWYLYSNPYDTIATRKVHDDNKYMSDLSEDIDSLNSIINRCKYDYNKKFFISLQLLDKNILHIHENQSFKNNPVIKITDLISNDTILIDRLFYRNYSDEVNSSNADLLEYVFYLHKQYETSMKPDNLLIVFHPVVLIYNRYCGGRIKS